MLPSQQTRGLNQDFCLNIFHIVYVKIAVLLEFSGCTTPQVMEYMLPTTQFKHDIVSYRINQAWLCWHEYPIYITVPYFLLVLQEQNVA